MISALLVGKYPQWLARLGATIEHYNLLLGNLRFAAVQVCICVSFAMPEVSKLKYLQVTCLCCCCCCPMPCYQFALTTPLAQWGSFRGGQVQSQFYRQQHNTNNNNNSGSNRGCRLPIGKVDDHSEQLATTTTTVVAVATSMQFVILNFAIFEFKLFLCASKKQSQNVARKTHERPRRDL